MTTLLVIALVSFTLCYAARLAAVNAALNRIHLPPSAFGVARGHPGCTLCIDSRWYADIVEHEPHFILWSSGGSVRYTIYAPRATMPSWALVDHNIKDCLAVSTIRTGLPVPDHLTNVFWLGTSTGTATAATVNGAAILSFAPARGRSHPQLILLPSLQVSPGSAANVGCIAAVVATFWFTPRLIRKRLRRRAGLCPSCGYNLTGISDRCPECGTPRPPPSPAGL